MSLDRRPNWQNWPNFQFNFHFSVRRTAAFALNIFQTPNLPLFPKGLWIRKEKKKIFPSFLSMVGGMEDSEGCEKEMNADSLKEC